MGKTQCSTLINLNVNDEVLNDQEKVADEFGKFLLTVAETKIKNHFGNAASLYPIVCNKQPNSVFLEPVTHKEVELIIKSLKNKVSRCRRYSLQNNKNRSQ